MMAGCATRQRWARHAHRLPRPPTAGVFFVGGVVGRGVELRALQQAALSLRLAVGTAAKAFSPRG